MKVIVLGIGCHRFSCIEADGTSVVMILHIWHNEVSDNVEPGKGPLIGNAVDRHSDRTVSH